MAGRIDDLRARHRPERVALVLGTSTSSIGSTEEAYARLSDDGLRFPPDLDAPILHTPHSLGHFVQQATCLRGPCNTVATARSPSATVLPPAAGLLRPTAAAPSPAGGVARQAGHTEEAS